MQIGDVVELASGRISAEAQTKFEKTLTENSTLKRLCLPITPVSDDVVDAMCRFVQKNRTMTHLQLGKANLSAGGLSRVLDSLSLNTTLVSIELWECPITDAAVDAMCSFVQQNRTMTHLVLHRATFSDSGLSRILHTLCSNTTLVSMALVDSEATDKVVDTMCNFVELNKTLTYLILGRATFSDSGLSRILDGLCCNSTLEVMDLWKSNLTDVVVDAMCSFVRHNMTMTHLNLGRILATDGTMNDLYSFLKHNRTMKALQIPDSPVTDGVVEEMYEFIQKNESMTIFRLHTAGYQYTDSHLSTLMQTLGASSTLKTIRSVEKGQDPCVEVTMSDQENPSYFYFINVNDTLQLLEQEENLKAQKAALERKRRNEPLSDELKAVLDRNRVYLVDQIMPESVYDHLRQDNSLTAEEEEGIKFNKPRREQVRLLLDLLRRKSRQDYENFKRALSETLQEHIQERLNKSEQDAGLH